MTATIDNDRGPLQEHIPGWAEEAAALLELAKNAERTGVPADPRTRDRARTLLEQLDKAHAGVDTTENLGADQRSLSANRILKAHLEALKAEAQRACSALKA